MIPRESFHFEISVPRLSPQEKALYRRIPGQGKGGDRPKSHSVKEEPPIKEEEPDVDLLENPAVRIKAEYEARGFKAPEIKKEAIVLSGESVARRLQVAGCSPLAFQADRDLTKVGFTRKQLVRILGGSSRATACRPRESRYHMIHDLDFYLAPMRERDPHTPLARGEPGVLLGPFKPSMSRHSSVPLFAKLPRHAGDQGLYDENGLWFYYGHYSMKESEPLTTDEWNLLPDNTRNLWADGYSVQGARWWYTRAAVALYVQEERPATEDEIRSLIRRAAAGKDKIEVTRKQVKMYWAKGVDRIATCAINCERFDEWFQKDLVEKADRLERELLEPLYNEMRQLVPISEKRKWAAKEKEARKRRRFGKVDEHLIKLLNQKKKANNQNLVRLSKGDSSP